MKKFIYFILIILLFSSLPCYSGGTYLKRNENRATTSIFENENAGANAAAGFGAINDTSAYLHLYKLSSGNSMSLTAELESAILYNSSSSFFFINEEYRDFVFKVGLTKEVFSITENGIVMTGEMQFKFGELFTPESGYLGLYADSITETLTVIDSSGMTQASITGDGLADRIAYWSDPDTITYDNNFKWFAITGKFVIGSTFTFEESTGNMIIDGNVTIGGDLELQDNKKLYFNTAKTSHLGYYSGDGKLKCYHGNNLIYEIE